MCRAVLNLLEPTSVAGVLCVTAWLRETTKSAFPSPLFLVTNLGVAGLNDRKMSAAPSNQVPLPPIPGLGELDVDIRKGPTGSLGINVRQSQLCLQVRVVFPTLLDEVPPVLLWPAKRLPRRHATTLYPLPLSLGSGLHLWYCPPPSSCCLPRLANLTGPLRDQGGEFQPPLTRARRAFKRGGHAWRG